MTSALTVPFVAIQDSFPEVIQDVQEGIVPLDRFCVSCYKRAEPSVHAKINVELDNATETLSN